MEQDKEHRAGDICFYDKEADKLIVIGKCDWDISIYTASRYIPIGVVVIPSSHDVYGTGQCAVISLKEMHERTPNNGYTSHQWLYWGQYNVNTPLPNLSVVVTVRDASSQTKRANGAELYSYLPSDNFRTSYKSKSDPFTCYSTDDIASPSPYLEDGSRNPVYYQTKGSSSIFNCLADFDGVGNTKVLCELATAQPKWKTVRFIKDLSSMGYSPAACCCWRYHTEGTKQGDWYLPACGELGYMIVRLKTINNTIENLINAYGNDTGVLIDTSNYYWSSSEASKENARFIHTRNGRVAFHSKAFADCIRAFLRV